MKKMKKMILVLFSLLVVSQTVSAETISGKANVIFSTGSPVVSISVAPQFSSPLNGSYEFIIQDDDHYPRYITAIITGPNQSKTCTLPDSVLTVTGVPVINHTITKLRQLQTINPNVGTGNHMSMNIYDNPNWSCAFNFNY
ncbi:MAG: hypothetical protein ACC657_05140 [Thiohalomonadales bacterium]